MSRGRVDGPGRNSLPPNLRNHATDHLEAPKLMFRAYRDLIGGVPAGEQTQFDFEAMP
jgi:hypothetical protein